MLAIPLTRLFVILILEKPDAELSMHGGGRIIFMKYWDIFPTVFNLDQLMLFR